MTHDGNLPAQRLERMSLADLRTALDWAAA